jgi:hypothetical protein
MTIHRKALGEHFLMVPLVFWFNHWGGGEMDFLNFPQKNLSLNQRVKALKWRVFAAAVKEISSGDLLQGAPSLTTKIQLGKSKFRCSLTESSLWRFFLNIL